MLSIFNKSRILTSKFGFEKKKKRISNSGDQMQRSVRKILESADQKLIVMVRG